MNENKLIEALHLCKYFPIRGGFSIPLVTKQKKIIRAVDDVSFHILQGETLAVVGESGCGKSTLARTTMLLIRPTSGTIKFEGQDVTNLRGEELRRLRRNLQIVFQDPESSLDPRYTVSRSVSEPLEALTDLSRSEIEERAAAVLEAVGLGPEFMERFPRQLSGGQKQRVSIARAIVLSPKLLVLDEPTSALDASIQAQILGLLLELQRKFDLSYMLITHNIAVAQYLADRIAVMYCGKMVEYGGIKDVIKEPLHPYTQTLITSAPVPNPWKRNILKIEIKGEVPSAINPPPGCRFKPRCPYSKNICGEKHPELEEIKRGHHVSCWELSRSMLS
jgi:oligopeptide transport system ATP-binding protein